MSDVALAGRDHALPPLAERRIIKLAAAAERLEARLYRPLEVAATAPLMLFFHGGGFVMRGLDSHEALCIRLGHAAGMRVLLSSYRLAPENRFPAQLDDALAIANAVVADPGLTTGPIVLAGDSAGGYLAGMTASILEHRTRGTVAAQLLLYPLLHLDEAIWATGPTTLNRMVGWAAARYIRSRLLAPGVSAASLLEPGLAAPVPTVVVAGAGLDPVSVDATRFVNLQRERNIPTEFRSYPGLVHGFANLTHLSRKACRAVAEAGNLIARAIAMP